MKLIFQSAFLLTLALTQLNAYGSEVFKCIDENGQTTFSFEPCQSATESEILEEVASTPDVPDVEVQIAALNTIEINISKLNTRFRDLRLELNDAILTNKNADKEKIQQIQDHYQEQTSSLLQQLAELKSQRSELVDSSMTLLSPAT